jgi:hypothetical protein
MFIPRSIDVGFVMDKTALRQVLSEGFRSTFQCSFHQMFVYSPLWAGACTMVLYGHNTKGLIDTPS